MENITECRIFANITDVTLSVGGISFTLVLIPLTSAVGLFTNGLTLLLLLKSRKWEASNILFFGLIVADFLSLVLQCADGLFNIHQFVTYHFSSVKVFQSSSLKIVSVYMQYIFLSLSKPLIVLIAVQRCSAVHRPLTFKLVWTKKRTTVLAFILTAIVALVGIGDSAFLAVSEVLQFDECDGSHFLTEMVYDKTIYVVFDYTIVVFKTLVFVTPIPLTIGLNVATVVGIIKNRKMIKKMDDATSHRMNAETEITNHMLLVSMMFLVMNIPYFISAAILLPNRYDTFHVLKYTENEVKNLIYDASTFLITLNMTTNCLIYVAKTAGSKSNFCAICRRGPDDRKRSMH